MKRIVMPEDYRPWDVDIDTAKVSLERTMRALLVTGSTMTDHMRIGDYPLGRGISAFLRVQIPDGREDEFRSICKPQRMQTPPPPMRV